MLWMYALTIAGWPFGVATWFPLVLGVVSLAARPNSPAPGLVGALILSEWVRWHAPFGGVPLSVLAMSQGEGPLLPVARVASTLGVSASVAALGAALYLLARSSTRRSGVVVVLAVVAVSIGGVYAPRGEAIDDIEVAVVQGGGEQQTVDANTDYTEVLNRHLDAARTATNKPDLILLPENIVNVAGNFDDSLESDAVGKLASEFDSTVIVGIVEDRSDPDSFWNAAAAFDETGTQVGRYDKVRRVPFGEYVPLRPFIERFGNDLLPGRDAKPGTDPAVIEVDGTVYGVAISWEVFFPRRVREAVKHDAQIILNPTNGSSYWLTQVQTQQIASSQLRAVESGRWLLQSSPTGFSAVIDPSGNVVERIGIGDTAVIEQRVELREGLTLGSRFGDLTALVLGFALVLWSLLAGRSLRGLSRRPSNL